MKTFTGAITAAVIFLCFFSAAAANPGVFPFEPDKEIRGLLEEATALALIDYLALTPDQRTEIKRILKPVHEEMEQMKAEEIKVREERIKPRLRQVIQDLKAGRDPASTPPEDVVESMTTVRTRMAALFTKANQAYGEITALLTPAQQERLRGFRFEEYIGPMPDMHPRRLLGMDPVKFIEEIRNSSQEEIEAMVGQIEQRHEARREFMGKAGKGARGEARDRKMQSFVALVKEIHAMPQDEFEAKVEQLKTEVEAATPRSRPGRGPGPRPPGPPPFMSPGPDGKPGSLVNKKFNTKRIIFSPSFYEAL
jgi:Spy/CpxP family protein refolding chaperone